MARKKGKLRDRSAIIDSRDQQPQFSVPGAEIVEVEQEGWGSIIFGWGKNLIGFIAGLFILVVVLFTALSCTIMVFAPLEGNTLDRTIVLRGAWKDTGGNPPLNTEIIISQTKPAPTAKNWWEWAIIGWKGIDTPTKVKIVSTNHDKLYINGTQNSATITNLSTPEINGTLESNWVIDLSKYKTETYEFNHQLKDEWLVECVSGDCTPNTLFVIGKQQIYGETR